MRYTIRLLLTLALLTTLISCKERKSLDRNAQFFTPPNVATTGPKDPMASDLAIERGEIDVWGSEFPKTFNVWRDGTQSSAEIIGFLYESLAGMRTDSTNPIPNLASTWEISPDQKIFTFHLNPNAKWSDGQAVTAEDVQYYWDVIMDSSNLTPVPRIDMERFERPQIIDAHTIRIIAKEAHWKNFWYAAGITPFPKHAWQNQKFDQRNWEFDIVDGPYKISKLEKNRFCLLQKRSDWWGRILAWNSHKYNFQRIRYRFVEDRTKALEDLKKGDLDVYPIYTASIWANQTQFESVKKGWVVRQGIWNKEPIGFQGMYFNLRKSKFQDLRVRQALALLLDRQTLNQKFMFNQYFLLNSYFADLYPNNFNPQAQQFKFNEDSARLLLNQAGWSANSDGILTKNGENFTIDFITAMSDTRHFEFFVNALSKLGIKATITKLSYPAYIEKIDKRDFDLDWKASGAERLRDVEANWSSQQADVFASANISGLKDAEIDHWIAQMRLESRSTVRDSLLRLIDKKLIQQIPSIPLWQVDHHRLLWWNRFGYPQNPLAQFQREDAILTYWWVDTNKATVLDQSRKNDQSIPRLSDEVHGFN